jgi:hypothetical protein
MRKIVRVEGKKVLLDTKRDEQIYSALAAAWRRTGTDRGATRGIDLFVHKTRTLGNVFYLFHWTRWEGEANYIEEIDLDEAQKFVEENIDYFEKPEEIQQLKELGLYPEHVE